MTNAHLTKKEKDHPKGLSKGILFLLSITPLLLIVCAYIISAYLNRKQQFR